LGMKSQKTVHCKICRRPVLTTGSNTTNLFYHLRKNHVKHYRESLQMRPKKYSRVLKTNPRLRRCKRLLGGDNSCRYNLHLQRHGPNIHC
jgi:hypothetical protein